MPGTIPILAEPNLKQGSLPDLPAGACSSGSAVEAVLFDLGDTILHFATWRARPYLLAGAKPAHARLLELGFRPPAYRTYARKLGVTLLRAMIWSRLTRREAQLMRAFKARHARMGMDLSDELMVELAHLSTKPICEYVTLDSDAIEVLRFLKEKNLQLGVVSNTLFPAMAIDDVLRREGLFDFFPTRIYSSEVGYMKPHPKIFEVALRELNADPAHTLYVGDRLDKDVRGAQRVGMRAVLLMKKPPPRRLRPRPDFVIHSLQEIIGLIAV